MNKIATIRKDEELVQLSQNGDKQATDELLRRYADLVRGCARGFFMVGGETEDLIQEGMIGLFKAIRDYDAGRDASFYTFAELCISRQMYTAVQASNRKKHMPLNSYISLYGTGENDNGENVGEEFINFLGFEPSKNPEQLLIDKENVLSLERKIEEELSTFEKQVLDLYLTGMSYSQIARVLGRDEKSTDNALQRMKSKIRKVIAK
jgi:RNA polymerase sporulation-specific sigma factor